MAIPYQVQVASTSHQQVFVPASFIASSMSVLNPNNGVAYVARNRDCLSQTTGAWDWKVPSQSYAWLPGPFQSVGVYYLDQSGAALPGDISFYASETKLDMPMFQAIGRSQASVVTTLDIGQGTQPQPPAANNVRLWADGNGDLHILSSGGTDNLVYDSSNIGTVALGGDLYGTIANAHINVKYNQYIQLTYLNGTSQRAMQPVNQDMYLFTGNSGRMYFWSDTPAVNLGNWDAPTNTLAVGGALNVGTTLNVGGAAYVASTITTSSDIHAKDIYADRGNSTGVFYVGGAADRYLYFDGSRYLMGGAYPFATGGPVTVGTALQVGSTLNVLGNQFWLNGVGLTTSVARGYGALTTNTGQGDFVLGGGGSILYMHPNFTVGLQQASPYCTFFGNMPLAQTYYFAAGVNITWNGTYLNHSHSIQFNTTGNQIVWPNGSYISGNAGYAQGSNAALKQSLSMLPDDSLLSLVSDPRMPVSTYLWPDDPRRSVGFMADDIARVLPDLVLRNDNGEASGYAPTELTAILWGAVRALAGRVDDLTAELNA
jgi:hypothetical protein